MDEAKKLAREKRSRENRKRNAAYWRERRERTKHLTKDEIDNGWTAFELQRYLKERDEAANRRMGLGGREPLDTPAYGADHYSPFDW